MPLNHFIKQIIHKPEGKALTFFNLKMCRLPFPLVETFFSDAGALYLVLRNRAERLWISCLDCKIKRETKIVSVVLFRNTMYR